MRSLMCWPSSTFKSGTYSDGASAVNRTPSEGAYEESGEVHSTVEAVISFKKRDQLQRHGNGSPKQLTADTSLSVDPGTVIIQEGSHSE